MKTLLVAVVVLFSILAQAGETWRMYKGEIYNLTYFRSDLGKNPEGLDGWWAMTGKVTQASAGTGALTGSLVRLTHAGDSESPLHEVDELVFVKNLPDYADGDAVRFSAHECGFFEYVNTLGAKSRVRAYDYGETPSKKEQTDAVAEKLRKNQVLGEQRRLEFLKRMDEKTALSEAKKAKEEARIVAALKIRIQAGSADAAWDLGNRYLQGKGVEVDLKKGSSLIGLASQRGNERAKEWLLKTPAPQPLTQESK